MRLEPLRFFLIRFKLLLLGVQSLGFMKLAFGHFILGMLGCVYCMPALFDYLYLIKHLYLSGVRLGQVFRIKSQQLEEIGLHVQKVSNILDEWVVDTTEGTCLGVHFNNSTHMHFQ